MSTPNPQLLGVHVLHCHPKFFYRVKLQLPTGVTGPMTHCISFLPFPISLNCSHKYGRPGTVAHTCNPSYSGGGGQKIVVGGQSGQKN
jgi:hypothetical protein